jgi:hypothetical protein
MRSAAYAQLRVREPLGERTLGERTTVGAAGCDIVVPGVSPEGALAIERRKGVWVIEPGGKGVRFNGRPLTGSRDLRRGDVLTLGDAQLVVTDISRTLLRVDVHHLVGNATIAPASTLALIPGDDGDGEVEIRPLDGLRVPTLTRAATVASRPRGGMGRAQRWLMGGSLLAALVVVAMVAALLQPVSIEVHPADAVVSAPESWLAIPSGGRLLLLPGKQVIKAQRPGYATLRKNITVGRGGANPVQLRLHKLPGKLNVDTGGIAAVVSVDGVEVGPAPGVLSIPAGERTLMVRAPHYVDYITNLTINGAGEAQDLRVKLQTAWGALKLLSIPEGARVTIDGVDGGVTPVTIPAASGVRRVRLAAPGWKSWESSVVLKAGETLSVGPVKLGQPDAHLIVRSEPGGADATVGGTHLGRTPAEIDLPSGIAHEVVLSAPGYKAWTRAVFAEPGSKLSIMARLEPILVRVAIQGFPADAEVMVDGVPRGKAPRSLELPATEHRVEVRKVGFQTFKTTVTPAASLDRIVQYQLVPAGTH